jgi:branched-chain amino acid transport system permease protein
MVSLAQMSFVAMAGYVIGIGSMRYGLPHYVLAPLAVVGATALSALFGLIAIRGKKIYFLIMTLALSQLFYGVGMQWATVTGGYNGITGISRPTILGFSLIDTIPLYYLTLLVTAASYVALRHLIRSPFGLSLQGVRDNPRRMAALGFNVQMIRYFAIVVSGFFAGIAGVLTVYFTGNISPQRAHLPQSVLVVMAALVGGVRTFAGGVLGGILVAFLISIASSITTRYWSIVGVLFIVIVIFMPNGLLGGDLDLKKHVSRITRAFANRRKGLSGKPAGAIRRIDKGGRV